MLCLNKPRASALQQRCERTTPAVRVSQSCTVARSASAGSGSDTKDDVTAKYYNYIADELALAREYKKNLLISDVTSDEGSLQWVDLVLAGGGLLGIAHVGFVCVLEEAGVRFRGIGGTSAGAINAIIIAATRKDPQQTSWEETIRILSNAPFERFQDGKDVDRCNAVLKKLLGGDGGEAASLKDQLWPMAKAALFEGWGVWQKRGLHPGNKFQEWVRQQLNDNGIKTAADLLDKMSLDKVTLDIRPPAQTRLTKRMVAEDNIDDVRKAELKLVASDIVTQTKVVFPEMADMYYKDPLQQDPSGFVRASMSVPLFFHPYEIDNIPNNDKHVRAAWWDKTKYPKNAPIPKKATFVDGGTLSNFPISLFDVEDVPLMPTVGCQLGVQRGKLQNADNPWELYKAMNNTSRHIGDYDFIIKNPIYNYLVATANTDGFGWLDFDMPLEKKLDLFREGAIAGVNLLRTFTPQKGKPDTWTLIKEIRRSIANPPSKR